MYYGSANEDPDSANEAALEVAEPEIMYYGSANEDPDSADEAAPEVAKPENIFGRLRRRFDLNHSSFLQYNFYYMIMIGHEIYLKTFSFKLDKINT